MSNASKRTIRLLALLSILAITICLLPTFLAKAPVTAKADNSNPRIGCWWWKTSDANNEEIRDRYLSILESAGVTEIYYYDYTSFWSQLSTASTKRAYVHKFIEAAMSHGMRVAILIGDPDLAKKADTSLNYVQRLKTSWDNYKAEYPNDGLYGIHFDVEPGNTTTILQQYCDNLLTNCKNILIPAGIHVAFDVNPAWSGGLACKLDDIQGLYNIMANMLANGKGVMSLMSYRTTAAKVMSRANEKNAITSCLKYNCDFDVGIETDNVEKGVDLHDKTKDQVLTIIDEIKELIQKENYSVKVGINIHNARTFCELEGNIGDSRTTKAPTTTTTTAPIIINPIVPGDVNDDCEVDMKDVLALRKHLAGLLSEINQDNADVNYDGLVDMKDVLMIRKVLANLASF